jgi:hypothetical protein
MYVWCYGTVTALCERCDGHMVRVAKSVNDYQKTVYVYTQYISIYGAYIRIYRASANIFFLNRTYANTRILCIRMQKIPFLEARNPELKKMVL